jgi:ribosome-binding protein aMBF1 (putative translation factor)
MPTSAKGDRSSVEKLPRRPGQRSTVEAWSRYERSRTAIMIGSTVRAARRRAGVTQAELARMCSTSQPAIARLEKGMVAPTVVSLDRIARALGAELVVDFEPVPLPKP